MQVNGKKIKELRGGMSIEEIAVAADLSTRRIQQIEAEEKIRLNLNVAKAIARKLKVALEVIAAGVVETGEEVKAA